MVKMYLILSLLSLPIHYEQLLYMNGSICQDCFLDRIRRTVVVQHFDMIDYDMMMLI